MLRRISIGATSRASLSSYSCASVFACSVRQATAAAASTTSSFTKSSDDGTQQKQEAQQQEQQQQPNPTPRDFYARPRDKTTKTTNRVEGQEPNFSYRRDSDTEAAYKDPRRFRQDQQAHLKYTIYVTNVMFGLTVISLVMSIGFFQVWNSQGFIQAWERWFGTKRNNYWTRRNESVDSKMHQHNSVTDMLGIKSYNYSCTDEKDDVLLVKKDTNGDANKAFPQQQKLLD